MLEAIRAVVAFPPGTKSCGQAISQMIEKKIVPIEQAGFYRMIKKYTDGVAVKDEWNCKGRPRLLSDEGLMEVKVDLLKHSGKTIEKEEI